MATVTQGYTWISGETVTPAKLNSAAAPTVVLADGEVTAEKLAATLDLSSKTVTLPDDSVIPAKLSQPLTLATAQATTSGTSIDFTGIPSWVKRITVMLRGVSTSGNTNIFLYIGDSGGFETSNYTVNSFLTTSAGAVSATFPTGSPNAFVWFNNGSNLVHTGHWILTNITGNVWIATHMGLAGVSNSIVGAGSKTLSDTLTQLRLTTANGTDTFDAGEVNIMYEG